MDQNAFEKLFVSQKKMMSKKNRFVIVSPMRNASKTLPRMLHSIVGQSYENWKLILIDDASDIDHRQSIVRMALAFQDLNLIADDRIKLIINDERKWEIANVITGLSMCEDDDIVVRVDADDFLTDLDAFRIIDEVYRSTGCDMLWTAHRWHSDERVTMQNISGPFTQGTDPYKHPWVSSHLRTFRKRLLNNVKDENYRGVDGEYFRRIGDQCFALPSLKFSRKNIYLPMVMYSYRCDMRPETFQTEDAKFQRDEALYLRARGFIE